MWVNNGLNEENAQAMMCCYFEDSVSDHTFMAIINELIKPDVKSLKKISIDYFEKEGGDQ